MNKLISNVAAATVVTMLGVCPVLADDARGIDRAANGVTDAITSPGQVVEGVAQDAQAYGPVGVVTGSVKGGVRAAGQLVTGAANVGVGVVETLVQPFAAAE
ncbi:MAG: hypothetical protein AB7O21_19820 [Gammaproteobacteria bacterium]